jgi:hypothetical protein
MVGTIDIMLIDEYTAKQQKQTTTTTFAKCKHLWFSDRAWFSYDGMSELARLAFTNSSYSVYKNNYV